MGTRRRIRRSQSRRRPMTPPRSRRRQRTRRAKSPRRRQLGRGTRPPGALVQGSDRAVSAELQSRGTAAFEKSQGNTEKRRRMTEIEEQLNNCTMGASGGTSEGLHAPCKSENFTEIILEYNKLANDMGLDKTYCNRTYEQYQGSQPTYHRENTIPVIDKVNLACKMLDEHRQARVKSGRGQQRKSSVSSGRRPSVQSDTSAPWTSSSDEEGDKKV